MVDLLTNRRLTWKPTDDGRVYHTGPLSQSREEEAELLREVRRARTALIEQVRRRARSLVRPGSFFPSVTSTLPFRRQVADLDDDFAELLLSDFSHDFDAVPSVRVSRLDESCRQPPTGALSEDATAQLSRVSHFRRRFAFFYNLARSICPEGSDKVSSTSILDSLLEMAVQNETLDF